MATSAIFMMLFGFIVTWGGAAYCISLAMKSKTES
ncbi:MetS family NSS transporter small subunit [Photobacterium damselae]|uniref:MetS family NSS transporter small subunit n=1 Tax=Photobacterium damselae TaxID=38293 RepID=A0ABD6X030_PHODM|nr:MetS family NSS transporter small subunit [Photobacterium damselae]PSB84824.1 MetS family NSS transporter small subunit [Photobacterium damselae subsp. damselae]PSU15387.1 MetS family NSS transporter small subunit [Photobacterium damselae]